MMMIDYIATFVFFFVVIGPIGTIPVFIAVTNGFSVKAIAVLSNEKKLHRQAQREIQKSATS